MRYKKMDEKEKQLIKDVFNLMGQYSAWRLRDKDAPRGPVEEQLHKG